MNISDAEFWDMPPRRFFALMRLRLEEQDTGGQYSGAADMAEKYGL